MDAVTRVDDAIALAGYVRALVRRYAEGDATPCHLMLVQENNWRAARFGLDGIVVDPVGGAATTIRRLVERTLVELEPYGGAELEGIRAILRDGPGAARQLRAYAAGDGIRAVARAVVDETAPCLA